MQSTPVSAASPRCATLAHSRCDLVSLGRWGLFGLLLIWQLMEGTASAGTWTQVANSNPGYYNGTMLLLTDGSVMVQSAYDYQTWTKLTPDGTGSYVNGTWTTLAKMSIPRRNFGSVVMTDGRVFVLGGEYSGQSLAKNQTNSGEIYDPVNNKWSAISPYPDPKFGSGPVVLHPFGYILAGSSVTATTYFYYPPSDFWFTFGNGINGDAKLRMDNNTEETWLLQPDDSVLSYDVNASITNSTPSAQVFSTSTDTWTDAGTPLAMLSTAAQNSKVGPGGVLANGTTILIGGNENTAIYTPPAIFGGTGTWAAGPTLPAGMGADDAPGAVLPDGHFIFMADFYKSTRPSVLFDYDYNTNTLTNLTSTLPANLKSYLNFYPSNKARMLVLPDGGLLLTTSSYDLWEYKTSGSPKTNWRPTISSISKVSGGTYTLYGTRLNGISEGATFGNEARMSTNYPIVRLDQVGVTKFARTTNWNPGISVPGDNSFQSVDFDIPAGLPSGTYYVSVITNGISALSTPVTFTRGNVNASFSNGTLNINGDAEANNVQIVYKQVKVSGVLKSASVTVTAGDSFTTVNGTNSVTLDVGINRFNANIQMAAGNDVVSVSSLFTNYVIVNLADGDDTLSFTYNTVANQLVIDGGTGFDTVTLSGNSIASQTTSNVP